MVFLLTDDEDLVLGTPSLLPNTQKLFVKEGMSLASMFATTPVCCPSRSSYLTGKHIHNLGVVDNSVAGNCSSVAWQEGPEKQAFAVELQHVGYKTAYFGKYLNNYGFEQVGGTAHIPPGWNEWQALVGNSQYYNYTLSANGISEHHGDDYAHDYLTDIVKNRSLVFIRDAVKQGSPFFAMLAPPAAHDPTEPAPQHAELFTDIKAPRTPNYGNANKDKHWFIRTQGGEMSLLQQAYADLLYRRRALALLSVDDLVRELVEELETLGIANNTYIFYTSDNGYHTGQFGILKDKRLPYESDAHLPGYVRGPTVSGGSVLETAVLNIDFAPTFLELAGLAPASKEPFGIIASMDGRSFASSVLKPPQEQEKRNFLLEYNGEGGHDGMFCMPVGREMKTVEPKWHGPDVASCQDSKNQTYRCVRSLGPAVNELFCSFTMEDGFIEYYPDINADPWHVTNQASLLTKSELEAKQAELSAFESCKGESCRSRSTIASTMHYV